mmetsp:Transcript_9440/g.14466  ORF Transcript_9440/g.14466 Transcript_9440/m.14466 type:complete len:140 (-) Transcript_9440:29-448(-)|eukprot:CAMPEP_0202700302 /NCGR_PEP_ID=MMETSP1385-20130828/13484_1 /ASSEMBLY_ACC=CAM_ASM_000861 /TAXON_ID=933848 /ORGANISM="Elphidium margaritaceum" /LENGTH=139 /DNA_ID=CAMNT_0049357449 /DNA_START=121 /DNA_END=540 /DNA_ORIENTATION=-
MDQDWSNVTLTKSKPFKGKGKAAAAGKGSKKKDDEQKTEAKQPRRKRPDDENEDFRTAKIGKSFSVALQQGRVKKGWTQQQLAQMINVRQTVINQYESGKAIPDSQIISKLNRILGIKLPAVKKPGQNKKKKAKPKSGF